MSQLTMTDPGAALRLYSLDAPAITGRHAAGIVNDNWLLADAAGELYFLRGYRRVRDPERVDFQLRFQEHLLGQGFPTSGVIKTSRGELAAMVAGMPWALFAYVDGREFDFSRIEQAREAGRRLAQFHAVADGYDGPVVAGDVGGAIDFSVWLAPVSSHTWRDSVLADEYQKRLRQLFAAPEFEVELEFFHHWRHRVAQAWPRERLAALPRAWLHCDYHGRNMVFIGDEMGGLFDFDFLAHGPRVFDVGRAIFNFGREARGSVVMRDEFVRAFLTGYDSAQPLTAEERESLGLMAVLNWVPDAAFYAARRAEEGDPRIGERLQHDVKMMRGIQVEMQRLAPAFGWTVV